VEPGQDGAPGRLGYATTYIWEPDKIMPYWSLIQEGGGQGSMSLDLTSPLTDKTPRACKLEVRSGGALGIANEGFWGVGVNEGEEYVVSFWAKGAPGFAGPLTASVEGASGAVTNVASVGGITGDWKQYKATIKASRTEPKGKFVLATSAPGTVRTGKPAVWADQ
jgi:hypothetical protein